MDHESFDRLVRLLGTAGSRRAALTSVLGAGSLGAIGAAMGKGKGKGEDGTKNRRKSRKKGKDTRHKKRPNDTTPAAPSDDVPADDAVAAEAADCLSLQPGSNLNKCNFNNDDLAGVDISSSSMRETTFRGADLCGADLSSSNLKNADFRGFANGNATNLTRADLSSSGCAGIKTNAHTIFCQTRTCNGAINNRDCASGQACCEAGDCADPVCQTVECQSRACVYSDQSNNQPGNGCDAPRNCCDTACVDTRTDPDNCGQCGNACEARQICDAGTCAACDVCLSGCDFDSVESAVAAAPSGATIRICAGLYFIDAFDLSISKSVSLIGAGSGAGGTTLQTIAGGAITIFTRDGDPVTEVEIRDLTATSIPGREGGITNQGGNLTLTRVLVTGNQSADAGGGVANLGDEDDPARTVLNESIVTDNTAEMIGGGLLNSPGDIFVLGSGTKVTGNRAGEAGGGIWNDGGTVILQPGSVVENNIPDNCAGDPVPGCTG